jgi:hypothetical protein
MITIGYCSIPEALTLFARNGKSLEHLTAAMLNGELRVYVQIPTQFEWEICRVPREDLQAFSDEKWEQWLPRGRVPPDPVVEARAKTPFDEPYPELEPTPDVLARYAKHRLFLSEQELDRWLGGLDRSGAAGRPTSMHVVLAEFERRRSAERCEKSRSAEAACLAAWLSKEHPGMPPLTAKTIMNKLPTDFQPARK